MNDQRALHFAAMTAMGSGLSLSHSKFTKQCQRNKAISLAYLSGQNTMAAIAAYFLITQQQIDLPRIMSNQSWRNMVIKDLTSCLYSRLRSNCAQCRF